MSAPTLIGTRFPNHTVRFAIEQLARYSAAAHDHNPIHHDAELAKRAGLADCAVHGMLIAGQFETMILRWHAKANLVASSIRFVRPAIANQPHVIGGRIVAISPIEGADVIARLDVRNDARQVICLADLHLRIEDADDSSAAPQPVQR